MPKNSYDVAIIGAGISGLIAGCYLAQAGLRIYMTEQHYAVGGCCSFFKRQGFTFECGAHSLGSLRAADGYLYEIFNDIGIYKQLGIQRAPCSDTVITKQRTINFLNDEMAMADELSKSFKHERKGIVDFFKIIHCLNRRTFAQSYSRYKKISFEQLISNYFTDPELKEILSVFLGNVGVPANRISALTAMVLYKEFVFDGGYYVDGGMQKLGMVLKKRFESLGGDLTLRNPARKIEIKNNTAVGLETERSGFVEAKYIISTAGLTETFKKLIEPNDFDNELTKKINQLKPSVSAVVLYLGLRGTELQANCWGRTAWYMPNLNPNEIFGKVLDGTYDKNAEIMLLGFPSKFDACLAPENSENMMCILLAPSSNLQFWKEHKESYREVILARLEEIVPNIRQRIIVSEFATPETVRRFTLNDGGAIYGLASTSDQIDRNVMPQKTSINNLFLASHWSTQGYAQSGVPVVAIAAKQLAASIIKNERKVTVA